MNMKLKKIQLETNFLSMFYFLPKTKNYEINDP